MPFWRLNIPFAMSKDNIRYVKTHFFCFFNKYKTATLLWFQFLTINFVLPVKTVRTTITSKLLRLKSGFEGLSEQNEWVRRLPSSSDRTVTYNRHHNKSQAENRAQIDHHQTFPYPSNPKKVFSSLQIQSRVQGSSGH